MAQSSQNTNKKIDCLTQAQNKSLKVCEKCNKVHLELSLTIDLNPSQDSSKINPLPCNSNNLTRFDLNFTISPKDPKPRPCSALISPQTPKIPNTVPSVTPCTSGKINRKKEVNTQLKKFANQRNNTDDSLESVDSTMFDSTFERGISFNKNPRCDNRNTRTPQKRSYDNNQEDNGKNSPLQSNKSVKFAQKSELNKPQQSNLKTTDDCEIVEFENAFENPCYESDSEDESANEFDDETIPVKRRRVHKTFSTITPPILNNLISQKPLSQSTPRNDKKSSKKVGKFFGCEREIILDEINLENIELVISSNDIGDVFLKNQREDRNNKNRK